MKLVKITWRDAQLLNPHDGRFTDPREFEDLEPAVIEVVGWVVADKPTCVVVAQEMDAETGEVKLIHLIPREAVVDIVELQERKREVASK